MNIPSPLAADLRPQRLKDWLRAQVRAREFNLAILALIIGGVGGAVVVGMSATTKAMHAVFFGVTDGSGVSAARALPLWSLLIPAAGGAALGVISLLLGRWRKRQMVDPIEANALHGGRMSVRDSLIIAIQNLISNGFGASVGLEAGYTQMGSMIASRVGVAFRLRRQDMRTLVGCGAAAAIGAAFDAPITGAFYAFELIIGSYAIGTMAPVMAAAVSATLAAKALGGVTLPLELAPLASAPPSQYPIFLALGFACGLLGIALMRSVSKIETLFNRSPLPAPLRPVVGGLLIGGLGFITPQALAAGHGALHMQLHSPGLLYELLFVFVLKSLASAISLGSGFRGGLFFASLFLGAVLGRIVGGVLLFAFPGAPIDPTLVALTGMSALAVAIIGGPLTMTFLALETTGDLTIAGVALAASVIASLTVRELFGYSFSTWRLHLRGETIRSALDVGWIRSLTVGRMMRPPSETAPSSLTVEAFRQAFPLGSTTRVIAVDEAGRYAGIVLVADAYAIEDSTIRAEDSIAPLLKLTNTMLTPLMNVKQAIAIFERSESEALVVVGDQQSRKVVGFLTEAFALRRYSEELDLARRGAIGEKA